MTFEEWCYNNGYTQLDVDMYNFGKEVFNAGVAEGFEQAIIKECEEKQGKKNDKRRPNCTIRFEQRR